MTGHTDGDWCENDLVGVKLRHQCERLRQLLQGLTSTSKRQSPCVCVVEAYSREKLEASARQALTGFSVPNSAEVECEQCGRSVSAGDDMQLRAHRSLDTLVWYVETFACDGCELVLAPQDGCLDVVASARLAAQPNPTTKTAQQVLVAVSITAAAGNQYLDETQRQGATQ